MAFYEVDLRGEFFPLHDRGRWKLFGFETTCHVEAESAQNAEMEAVKLIHIDPVWQHIRPRPGFPTPRLYPEGTVSADPAEFSLPEYDLYRMVK
ncbi:hypothetical protein [Ponticaulis sp.]|uniref:hypothetical protein n=1 Tax=Ponticaulis sp. TaxID=2020902 RepID=UPI000B6F3AF9|nr:hypothetical protein [Ponticaulis sp.]MAJ07807.1 hypothetical protein [Ponticaulis sp.]RPG18127.1 MAG: hypothetical protein CBC85_002525 [Hyphomonadaceae bacterium TMED125]HBH90504.1 hypothetical protein [Hyphomonadaceae bacterium]HBJ93562.1 hypothetical protein [Hyphomonadaceae bacterium]|tara:strand:+ start:23157 stop:23438 length:282 start_codon:yes stop_codon:yes gene_type:complete